MRRYKEISIEDSDFAAYLVIELTEWPLSFGGMRVDPFVTADMVRDLAENMALKLAGHGSRVGGAKAGLRASPDDPSLADKLRRFARACHEALSSTTILGKDMGAKQWMLDEIYAALGMRQLSLVQQCVTPNCPDRISELSGYIPNMTGKGVIWSIEQALGGALRNARVLIQGFGVVGAGTAWHLARAGARIVGVSDSTKAAVSPNYFDIDQLMAARTDNGLLEEKRLPRNAAIESRETLLERPADVLVLAAGSYLVNGAIARRIQSPLIIEAANIALLPDGREALHRSGARVVPDVVANSSSAALVAHQIASGNTLDPEAVWTSIESSIKRHTDAVERFSKLLNIDSKAAFRSALEAEDALPQARAAEISYAD